MNFPSVTVTCFDIAQEYLVREPWKFNCVLSLNDVDEGSHPPQGFEEFRGLKLTLFFDDVICTDLGLVPPSLEDAKKIVSFARAANDRILIHCAAGISRSTASAIAIPAVRMAARSVHADAIMRWLREVRPIARPNPLLVQMIDDLVGWNGRLSKAAASHFNPPSGSGAWM